MRLLFALATIVFATTSASAQNFPTRPITLVVPLAAGSTTDVAARLLSEYAGKALGEQIVVENKPGAGIMVGSASVAKAAPDGYTLLMGTVGLAVDPLLKKVPFDAAKDFTPVSLLINAPIVMLVNPKLDVKTFAAYRAKYKGAKDLTFSSGGTGTLPHLAGEIVSYKSGIPLRHVPYRGGGPAFNDVIAGHVNMMFGTPVTKPNIDNGDVRALAVSGTTRVSTLPDVPTFKEAGLDIPEIEEGAWFGLFAPAGTPKDIVAKVNAAFNAALKEKDVRARLEPLGLVARGTSPEDFHTFFQNEVKRWPDIFKKANIKPAE